MAWFNKHIKMTLHILLKIMSYATLSNLCCLLVLVAILNIDRSEATLGGATCNIPTGSPGASTLCTSNKNGFCAVDTLDIDKKTVTGICICYPGFTGDKCQTADPATAPGGTTGTSSSKGSGNAIGALALGGLAALALSQLGGGGLGGGYGGGYGGSISPREQLYLRQATAY
uniref:EGF-like domain-containing protein n=2 Tax=Magallana TaxID=2171616 RepID=A0A8W8IN60_MAGGI